MMYSQLAPVAGRSRNFPGISALNGLRADAASHLATIGFSQNIPVGETVFSEGDRAENVYEVVWGVLRLYKLLPDGRRQITGFLFSGHLLGLANGGSYTYGAEAITEASLRRYPRARFERMVDEVPGLAKHLLTVTFNELHAAQDQMLLLGRKSAAEKIASFLLNMAERQNRNGGRMDYVHIPMGRSDIADYLGLTKETVCKTLSKLKRDGVIVSPSVSRIELRNRGQLEELAAGERGETF
jgi:CRP/FNR family transcriptional regulator